MRFKRCTAVAAAVTMAASAIAVPATVGAASKVKRPKGEYTGLTQQRGQINVEVAPNRRSVRIVFFQFACDESADGLTGLQRLPLKKTKKGYRFGATSDSLAVYSDDTEEDAFVGVAGRFNKNAKTVSGVLRVETERCGDSGNVSWLAAK